MCKRKLKADQKDKTNTTSSSQNNFNVDLVIKTGPRPNQTEKMASAKKYFSKNKRPRNLNLSKLTDNKQVELVSTKLQKKEGAEPKSENVSSNQQQSQWNNQEMSACLSPMSRVGHSNVFADIFNTSS